MRPLRASRRSVSVNFNSHTPHGVRRVGAANARAGRNFNSHTPHGVRQGISFMMGVIQDFNSHTPHGVRLACSCILTVYLFISTHTPHTGCDSISILFFSRNSRFQLTHPTRGATALSDALLNANTDFNSHTPHGVRLSCEFA